MKTFLHNRSEPTNSLRLNVNCWEKKTIEHTCRMPLDELGRFTAKQFLSDRSYNDGADVSKH